MDGEPRTATSTFTQPPELSASVRIQCCFTSTESVRTVTVRDGEPRTATSTFTQLLSSEILQFSGFFVLFLFLVGFFLMFYFLNYSSELPYVHRDHKEYWGRGAQDGHFEIHTAPEL